MLRTFTFVASGVLTVLDGAIGLFATVAPPTDAAGKAHLIDLLIVITGLAIAAFIILGVIDHKERGEVKVAQERLHRQVADLHAEKFAEVGTVAISGAATIATVPPSPTKLRAAAMAMAKEYRDFANAASEAYDPALLKKFWDKYPFKSLDDMKERLKVSLGFSVVSAAEWLPSTADNIRKIATSLEKEALRIPSDVLL